MKKEGFRKENALLHSIYYAAAICIMVCVCIWSADIVSYAAEGTYGNWKYEYDVNGATITAYEGNSSVVKIPSSIDGHKITGIDSYVFENKNMKEVTIPESITWIGTGAFYNCRKLTKIYFNAKNCSDCYDWSNLFYNAGADSGSLKVVFGSNVKSIPGNLFYVKSDENYVRITTVVMSNAVEKVGESAFGNCQNLENVTWGKSIKNIGKSAFANCIRLKSVTIPETVTEIGAYSFYNCKLLSSVYYNARNCSDCYEWAQNFYNAGADSNSLKVEFGSKVIVIPAYLFYVDANYNYGDGVYAHITSVKMSNSIQDIGNSAFDCCYDLKNVTWGKSIKNIGKSAFANCIRLKSVTIPETVTEIGAYSFYNCKLLSSVYYNARNCSDCYEWAQNFYNAGADSNSLKVEFGSKVKVIPAYLFYVDADYNYGDGVYAHITSVKMSNSIQDIGASAFDRCYDLKTVTWGTSIKTIGKYAFSSCGMASITLPAAVTNIGYKAFIDCDSLKKAVIRSKKAQFDSYVFYNCHEDLRIYCFKGSTALQYAKDNGIKYSYLDLPRADITSISNTSTGIKLVWKKVSGASEYYVYRKTGTTSFKAIKTVKGSGTLSYTDTSVKDNNGSTYYYMVKPYDSNGTSDIYTSKKIVRLKAVGISKIQNQSGRKLYVLWGKNTKATGYQLQYSASSSFSGAKTLTVSGYKNVSKTLSGLTKGKTYYVRVRVYKQSGTSKYYSAWSGIKTIKITK